MIRRCLVMLVVGCLLGACGGASGGTPEATPGPPSLDRATAERLAFAADDARRRAFAEASAGPLRGIYGPELLAAESTRLAVLANRGSRVEETVRERRPVHFSSGPGRAVVVLSILGSQRLAGPGQGVREASVFLRQTALDWGWYRGAWLVVATQDLPPDRWWP